MNILIINHYAGSPEMGMEFRPYYFAREWIKMGHRVDIIAADYSHLRRVNPEVKEDFQENVIDDIHYHWVKTGEYDGNGVKRAMTMVKFISKLWIKAKKILRKIDPDVVICSSTYPLDTYVGQKIRKKSKKKVKLIHEVHDMWPTTLIEIGGMSKKHPFVVAMQIGENSAYKNSDRVVSLLPYAESYMKEHGLRDDSFVCIPNGIVEHDWKNPKQLSEKHMVLLSKYKASGKYIVGYFGGHALSNALDVLLDIANNIEDDSIQFILVGDGVEKQRLMQRSKKMGLSNVSFMDPISKLEIPSLCKMLDCIYMGGNSSPLYRFGLCMNKMFDAMRAGKPSLCATTSPRTYLEEFDCGIHVDSEDVEASIQAIIKFKKMNIKEKDRIKNNGINAVKEYFEYGKLAEKFISIMR